MTRFGSVPPAARFELAALFADRDAFFAPVFFSEGLVFFLAFLVGMTRKNITHGGVDIPGCLPSLAPTLSALVVAQRAAPLQSAPSRKQLSKSLTAMADAILLFRQKLCKRLFQGREVKHGIIPKPAATAGYLQ